MPTTPQSYTKFNNPLEAEESLTSAFNPANEAQTQAIKNAAALIPDRTPQTTPEATQDINIDAPVGEVFSGLQMPTEQVDTGINTEEENFLNSLTSDTRTVQQIQEDAIAKMQAEIDATNQLYAGELERAKEQGRGRLGTTTAMGARRGLVGTDFGAAQLEQTQNLNNKIESSIEQERLARISALMTGAKNTAEQQIRERRAAMLQGYEARKAYYAGQEERTVLNTQKAVQSLISQGVDLDELSQAQLGQFAKAYGANTDDLVSQYTQQREAQEAAEMQAQAQSVRDELENRKIAAQIAQIDADIQSGRLLELSEGQMIYDTQTGQTFKNPKTFAPKTGSGTGGGVVIPQGAEGEPEYGSDSYYQSVISQSAGGKDLTQSESENIIQMQRAFAGVDSLVNQLTAGEIDNKTSKSVFGQKTGKVKGHIANLKQQIVGDADTAALKATIQGLIPTVARGIFGEVGVLTDADIANYKKTLPSLINTGRENEAVTLIMLDVLNKSYANSLETYALSGRDVSGFLPQYESFKSRVDNLAGSITGGQTTGDTAAPTLDTIYQTADDAQIKVIEDLIGQGYTDEQVAEYISLTQ